MGAVAEENYLVRTVFHGIVENSACVFIPCEIIFVFAGFFIFNIEAFRSAGYIPNTALRVIFFAAADVVSEDFKP